MEPWPRWNTQPAKVACTRKKFEPKDRNCSALSAPENPRLLVQITGAYLIKIKDLSFPLPLRQLPPHTPSGTPGTLPFSDPFSAPPQEPSEPLVRYKNYNIIILT